MEQKLILKQMIQFNKSVFDNSFKAMTMVYEQNERIIEASLEQAKWLPAEGRKAIKDWMGAVKTGCDDFKKLLDDYYANVEKYLGDEE